MSVLSIQTWHIHTLSLLEWIIAIEFVWKYAQIVKMKKFLKLSSFMVAFTISGICIINWHYFSNFSFLIWLVVFQAFLTLIANIWFSRIYN